MWYTASKAARSCQRLVWVRLPQPPPRTDGCTEYAGRTINASVEAKGVTWGPSALGKPSQGEVAQPGRALVSKTSRCRFNSCLPCVVVAQMVERHVANVEVAGSTPVNGTLFIRNGIQDMRG